MVVWSSSTSFSYKEMVIKLHTYVVGDHGDHYFFHFAKKYALLYPNEFDALK